MVLWGQKGEDVKPSRPTMWWCRSGVRVSSLHRGILWQAQCIVSGAGAGGGQGVQAGDLSALSRAVVGRGGEEEGGIEQRLATIASCSSRAAPRGVPHMGMVGGG